MSTYVLIETFYVQISFASLPTSVEQLSRDISTPAWTERLARFLDDMQPKFKKQVLTPSGKG